MFALKANLDFLFLFSANQLIVGTNTQNYSEDARVPFETELECPPLFPTD